MPRNERPWPSNNGGHLNKETAVAELHTGNFFGYGVGVACDSHAEWH
jgi:hypothetical protein